MMAFLRGLTNPFCHHPIDFSRVATRTCLEESWRRHCILHSRDRLESKYRVSLFSFSNLWNFGINSNSYKIPIFLSLSSLSFSGRIPAEMNNWNERIVRSQPLYRADVVGGLIASAVAANHGAFVSNRTGECVRIDKPYSPVRSIIHKSRQPGGCQRDKVVIVDQPRGERERERNSLTRPRGHHRGSPR